MTNSAGEAVQLDEPFIHRKPKGLVRYMDQAPQNQRQIPFWLFDLLRQAELLKTTKHTADDPV